MFSRTGGELQMQELIYYLSVHTTRKVKSEVIGQQRPASAVAAGLANRRRKIKHQPGVFDSRQTLSVRFAGSIDTVSNTAGCPPGVVLKAGCRTAALRLQMMHVSRPAQLDLMGPGCLVEPGVGESPPRPQLPPPPPPPPSTCPPPTSLIMRGRKCANTLSSPQLPLHHGCGEGRREVGVGGGGVRC